MTQYLNIDARFSFAVYHWARRSRRRSAVAMICASFLLWLLVGLAIGHYDPAIFRVIPVLFFPWGVSLLLSEWIQRPRPFHPEHYKPLIDLFIETPSFPSAHSTLAFALVSLFVDDPIRLVLFLVGAIGVAFGRVAVGVHYVSDTIVGACIGFGFGYAIQIAAKLFFV